MRNLIIKKEQFNVNKYLYIFNCINRSYDFINNAYDATRIKSYTLKTT